MQSGATVSAPATSSVAMCGEPCNRATDVPLRGGRVSSTSFEAFMTMYIGYKRSEVLGRCSKPESAIGLSPLCF